MLKGCFASVKAPEREILELLTAIPGRSIVDAQEALHSLHQVFRVERFMNYGVGFQV